MIPKRGRHLFFCRKTILVAFTSASLGDITLCVKTALFGFKVITANILGVLKFRTFNTLKFLNFRMPKNLLKSTSNSNKETKPQGISSKDANGIANSEDPDQTAPLGAV